MGWWKARSVVAALGAMVIWSASARESKAIFDWLCPSNWHSNGTAVTTYAPPFAGRPVVVAPALTVVPVHPLQPTVCAYVPQTSYRTAYRPMPVTTCQAVRASDPCTGCPVTVFRPITTYAYRPVLVPYTSYRIVAMNPCGSCCAAPVCGSCALAPRAPRAAAAHPCSTCAPCGGCSSCGAGAPLGIPSSGCSSCGASSAPMTYAPGPATLAPGPTTYAPGPATYAPGPTSSPVITSGPLPMPASSGGVPTRAAPSSGPPRTFAPGPPGSSPPSSSSPSSSPPSTSPGSPTYGSPKSGQSVPASGIRTSPANTPVPAKPSPSNDPRVAERPVHQAAYFAPISRQFGSAQWDSPILVQRKLGQSPSGKPSLDIGGWQPARD